MQAEISKGIKPAILQKKEKKPNQKPNKPHQTQKIHSFFNYSYDPVDNSTSI